MRNKVIFITILLVILILQTCRVNKLKEENERYEANQTALLQDVEYYKTESGKNAASVQKLTLTYDELKKNYDDVVKTAKELGISVGRIQSTSTTATQTRVNVITQLRDSVVVRDSVTERLRVFRWADPWIDVYGEIKRDSVGLDVQSCDTLVQIVHRVPHKFWFIKWGTKAIRQEIVSKNPHTKITYTEFIELKK